MPKSGSAASNCASCSDVRPSLGFCLGAAPGGDCTRPDFSCGLRDQVCIFAPWAAATAKMTDHILSWDPATQTWTGERFSSSANTPSSASSGGVGQFGAIWAYSWANPPSSGRCSANFGRNWPLVARFRPTLSDLGQCLRFRPMWVRVWPIFGDLGQFGCDFDRPFCANRP